MTEPAMLVRSVDDPTIMVGVTPYVLPDGTSYPGRVVISPYEDLKTMSVDRIVKTLKLAGEVAAIMRSKGFKVIQ